MGPEAEKVYSTFTGIDDDTTLEQVLDEFDTYFIPRVNVLHERARFYSRSQQADENIKSYVRKLYELSENAQFHDREESIRDRVVLGIRDRELSEKLQLQADLTVDQAIQQARQSELVKQQLNEQRHTSQSGTLDAVSHRGSRGGNPRGQGRGRGRGRVYHDHCSNCGGNHDKRATCPAKGKKCRGCGKPNHFERVCRSQKKANLQEVCTDEPETFYLGSVNQEGEEPPWRTSININGCQISFKIDTGADVSVITKDIYNRLRPKPKLRKSEAILVSSGGNLPHLGNFIAQTSFNGEKPVSFRVFVLDKKCDCLLSRSAAVRLGLVQRIDDVSDLAFGEIGQPVQCDPIKIRLSEDATPYSISTARRIPLPLLPKVEEELKRMEKNGVIEHITEPTDWCAPIVPILKKGGGVRICVDLKRLNRAVKRERYILPTIDDLMHKMKGSTVFTKSDATSGFWQLPLDSETAKLTTFITPFGRYFFRRLSFGISLAPEIFQRTMESILGDLEGVECFMNDILVHAENTEKHDEILSMVMRRLSEVGLKLNRDKCEFRKSEIKFLGHVFNKEGVKPDPTTLDAILKMEDPQDVSQLRRWLGMVNYLGRFIPNLSEELKPLNSLFRKDCVWTWGPAQDTAMNKVTAMLSEAPTLAFYDTARETVVSADASSFGLGGVLLQFHDGELKLVAFCSRTPTGTEKG